MASYNRAHIDEPHKTFSTILVLDFGSQYSHLICRRLRDLNVFSVMLACTAKLSELDWTPVGVILSGGPYSVYEEGAPHVEEDLYKLGVPILGICKVPNRRLNQLFIVCNY